MIDELEALKRARPEVAPPPDDVRAAARTVLETAVADTRVRGSRRPPRRRVGLPIGRLAPVAALLVVVAVVAAFLGIHGRKATAPARPGGTEFAFQAQPAAGVHGVNRAALTRAASLIASLGGGRNQVTAFTRGDRVVVRLGPASRLTPVELASLAAVAGRLAFYDWEANALTPSGQTVASLLRAQSPIALEVSEGGSSASPGSPGAGAMSLWDAVNLASRQAPDTSPQNTRAGPEYFLFGTPGSPACGAGQSDHAFRLGPAASCYLAGPTRTAPEAWDALAPGTRRTQAKLFRVPRGTVILEAMPSYRAAPPSLGDPGARFFVLRDRAAVLGTDVTNPRAGHGAGGYADVGFGFTPRGASAFQRVTAQISHRGELVSRVGETLLQHFAVALGDQLITVPSIDFQAYPDGVSGRAGADVAAGWTTAPTLAKELELGSLPIVLTATP